MLRAPGPMGRRGAGASVHFGWSHTNEAFKRPYNGFLLHGVQKIEPFKIDLRAKYGLARVFLLVIL